MTLHINIPDLRFQQTFTKTLFANAKTFKVNSKLQSATASNDNDTEQLPVITPSIVLYTVLKDVMIMPFVQGFAWALVLLLARPWLLLSFENGRRLGSRCISAVTALFSSVLNPLPRRKLI